VNRQQIAAIYDAFPESGKDLPREEFIRRATNALDPVKLTRDVNAEVQRRRTGRANKAAIDRVIG